MHSRKWGIVLSFGSLCLIGFQNCGRLSDTGSPVPSASSASTTTPLGTQTPSPTPTSASTPTPSPAPTGPVTLDSSANGNCGTPTGQAACTLGNTTLSYTLTVGNHLNRALAVFIAAGGGSVASGSGAPPPVRSVTYAGVSLIPITWGDIQIGNMTTNGQVYLYALPPGIQPSIGTNPVVITLVSAIGPGMSLQSGAFSVYGVNQSNTFASYVARGSPTGSTINTLTLPGSNANDLVIAGACSGTGFTSSSSTSLWMANTSTGDTCDTSAGQVAPGGTAVLSWATTKDWNANAGAVFNAASAPLPSVLPSPNGTTTTPSGSPIVDGSLTLWSVGSNLEVYQNGANPTGANVKQLVYYNGAIYHENNSLLWWAWDGSWVQVPGDPRL